MTPLEAGCRMPPEWALQEAVWLGWPVNPRTWANRREAAEKAFCNFAAAITRFEKLRLLCASAHQAKALDMLSEAGAAMSSVELFDIPTNDVWCRDYGPIFLKDSSGGKAVLDFTFNSWGGKFPPWALDDAVPSEIAGRLGLKLFKSKLVCEGGAIEVNGSGVLMATETSILCNERNPGADKSSVEREFAECLGVESVLWLESGMAWDDTDGHIDTLARFFREDAVLAAVDTDSSPSHAQLERNLEELKGFRMPSGGRLEIVPLPCPDPIRPGGGWRLETLPASYTNYLLVNGAVLVPSYRQASHDNNAIKILGQCFPGREIVPIDCYDIVLEGGALHCLSQQEPR